MSTAIELRGVEKSFGVTKVIQNVNLNLLPGSSALGCSGATAPASRR